MAWWWAHPSCKRPYVPSAVSLVSSWSLLGTPSRSYRGSYRPHLTTSLRGPCPSHWTACFGGFCSIWRPLWCCVLCIFSWCLHSYPRHMVWQQLLLVLRQALRCPLPWRWAPKIYWWNQLGNHCFSGLLQDVVLPFVGRLVSTRCSWHGHTGTSPGLSSHGLDGGTESSGICPCGLASCTQWCLKLPLSFLLNRVSRKESFSPSSTSTVNLIKGRIPLRCCRSLSTSPFLT